MIALIILFNHLCMYNSINKTFLTVIIKRHLSHLN